MWGILADGLYAGTQYRTSRIATTRWRGLSSMSLRLRALQNRPAGIPALEQNSRSQRRLQVLLACLAPCMGCGTRQILALPDQSHATLSAVDCGGSEWWN